MGKFYVMLSFICHSTWIPYKIFYLSWFINFVIHWVFFPSLSPLPLCEHLMQQEFYAVSNVLVDINKNFLKEKLVIRSVSFSLKIKYRRRSILKIYSYIYRTRSILKIYPLWKELNFTIAWAINKFNKYHITVSCLYFTFR